jgi:hypothetical protein
VGRVLVDFNLLAADGAAFVEDTINKKELNYWTTISYGSSAGQTYSEEEKERMLISLALDDWEVELASSSQTVENMRYSMCKEVESKTKGKVLGARIHFPTGAYNSFAVIKPPFEIPAYQPPDEFDPTDEVLKEYTGEEMTAFLDEVNIRISWSPGISGISTIAESSTTTVS